MGRRYTRDDGRRYEDVPDVGMVPVCAHCNKAVRAMNTCDRWFAGDDLAATNRKNCPRWPQSKQEG